MTPRQTVTYKRPMHGIKTSVVIGSGKDANGAFVRVREGDSFHTTKVYVQYFTKAMR